MTRLPRFLLPVLPLLLVAGCSHGSSDDHLSSKGSPIIGGELDTGTGAHNSVVMLFMNNEGACSGSLIAPNLVLTARHCVSKNTVTGISCDINGASNQTSHVGSDYVPSSIKVFTGVEPDIYYGTPAAVGTKIFHPAGSLICNADIALVLLNKAVAGASPMKMRLAFGTQKGELTMPVGYGKTASGYSGRRYRRANVPVVTSGRDWNQLTGAKEFALGQSTCQGDSGGPVLAMSTGAILGVTSRGGDCSTDNQTFSRLDSHAALINQALTEAGATALDEGLAAPAAPPIHVTGKGTCDTGSDCKDFLCKGSGASSYCTRWCEAGSCTSTTYCAQGSVVISGQTISDLICQPTPQDTTCNSCRFMMCKDPVEKCWLDSNCKKLSSCRDACTSDSCRSGCDGKYPAAASLYAAVTSCVCTAKCGAQCSNACGVVDAGVVDSGAPDSGVVDSGVVDSGVVDSEAADSGEPDTAVEDSGEPDSSASDAGADSGGDDVGLNDAAPSDSALNDAGPLDSAKTDSASKPDASGQDADTLDEEDETPAASASDSSSSGGCTVASRPSIDGVTAAAGILSMLAALGRRRGRRTR